MLATLVWTLYLVTFQPYSMQPVEGPFYSYQDCARAEYAAIAPLGSMYECESRYQP